MRQSRKPYVRPKKEKVVKPKEPPASTESMADIDPDAPREMTTVDKKPPKEDKDCAFLGGEIPYIFDANTMLETILKINTINFAGNLMLSWG